MCFAPQPRALFWWPRCQECSEPEAVLTFWLRNVLCATAACSSWTSQLPKVLRAWGVFLPFPIFHPIFHPMFITNQQFVLYFPSNFHLVYHHQSPSFPYFPSNFPSNVHHQPTVFYFHPMAIINQPLFANIFYPNFNFLSNVRHQPTVFSIFHLNFHPMFAINLPSPIFSTQSSSSTNHLFLFCIRFSIQCSSSTNHCPIFHKIFHPMLITNEQCPIFSNQSSIQCSSLTNHFPYLPSNLPSNVHHEPTSFPYFPSNVPSNVHHAPTIVSIFLIRFPSNVHHRPTIAPICSIQFFLHQSTNFLFIFFMVWLLSIIKLDWWLPGRRSLHVADHRWCLDGEEQNICWELKKGPINLEK